MAFSTASWGKRKALHGSQPSGRQSGGRVNNHFHSLSIRTLSRTTIRKVANGPEVIQAHVAEILPQTMFATSRMTSMPGTCAGNAPKITNGMHTKSPHVVPPASIFCFALSTACSTSHADTYQEYVIRREGDPRIDDHSRTSSPPAGSGSGWRTHPTAQASF